MTIQRFIRYTLSLSITVLFLLHVSNAIHIPFLSNLENQAYDARLKMTLPKHIDQYVNQQVVIVDIDEKSLAAIGQWPWNRNILAKINNTLFDHYQINAIGYDIVFAERDIDEGAKTLETMAHGSLKNNQQFMTQYNSINASLQHDIRFADTLKNRKTILGFIMGTGTKKGQLPAAVSELNEATINTLSIKKTNGFTANLAILQQSALSAGFFDNPLIDNDGVFRRTPLLQIYKNELHESLALALTRVATNSANLQIGLEEDNNGNADFLEWINFGKYHIPVDQLSGVLIPYIGKQGSFNYISATDVLRKKIKLSELKNKIILFGSSAPGLLDLRTTPLEPAYPGVEIQANIIQGILDNRILHAPGYTQGLEFLTILFLGLVLTFLLPSLSALASSLIILASIILLMTTNFYAWTVEQLVLPIASPVLLVILLFALQMTYGFFIESRAKRKLTHLFGQYVPPVLVSKMSKQMESINLDGEIKEMSVLFTDIRDFTRISENFSAKELTHYVNAFLTPITQIIHEKQGTIDKYMGDAVMAFWGAPLDDQQHARHALDAAMSIIEQMKILRKEFSAKQWPEIYIGIGVNTGKMNVGNKGSEFRVDYTVLGDAVNLGARLEGLAKIYDVDIVTSENTKHAVAEYAYRELDRVRVKGKSKSVTIYQPLGLADRINASEKKCIQQFHLSIKDYRKQNWDAAESSLRILQQHEPDRKIYQLYLDRISQFRENPPEKNWDGSHTHIIK